MRHVVFAAIALLATSTLALADQAEKTVEARQGYFKLVGANMGTLAGMAKGDIEYDAEAAQTAADNLVTLTSYDVGHLFAEGTSAADVDGSRALAKIWDDIPGLQAAYADFGAAAAEMDKVAGQGRAEMASALGALGGACKACHDSYRAK